MNFYFGWAECSQYINNLVGWFVIINLLSSQINQKWRTTKIEPQRIAPLSGLAPGGNACVCRLYSYATDYTVYFISTYLLWLRSAVKVWYNTRDMLTMQLHIYWRGHGFWNGGFLTDDGQKSSQAVEWGRVSDKGVPPPFHREKFWIYLF